jgi:hypothetical protein
MLPMLFLPYLWMWLLLLPPNRAIIIILPSLSLQ